MSASLQCRLERLAHRYDLSVGRLIVVEVQASRTRDSVLLAATLAEAGISNRRWLAPRLAEHHMLGDTAVSHALYAQVPRGPSVATMFASTYRCTCRPATRERPARRANQLASGLKATGFRMAASAASNVAGKGEPSSIHSCTSDQATFGSQAAAKPASRAAGSGCPTSAPA
jgi:hypothetical protein